MRGGEGLEFDRHGCEGGWGVRQNERTCGGMKYMYGVKPWMCARIEFPLSLTPYMEMIGTGAFEEPGTRRPEAGLADRGFPEDMSMDIH